MITYARALKIAWIAYRHGVKYRYARNIALAARKHRVSPALAFALVEQESDFKHIFGCDKGSIMCNWGVTKARYRRLQDHVRRGGTSNGVGHTQITYPGYILASPGLWKPRANVYFGLGLLSALIRQRNGIRWALAAYNGGTTRPYYPYADQVIERRHKWARRFA